ncbi:MAG: WYL domain-containing protein [Firmicutes bacterium]|nr:WYL domain-containing protein [Bacillota bacterium]
MSNNFGFIINEESRQHINLSTYAMKVIEADMIRFNDDYELKNKSGFINTIISNYYDDFPLSRSVALKQVDAIRKAIQTDNFSDKVTYKIIGEFTDEIMKNIINEYAEKYSNDIQFKLKLNKENRSLLVSLEDASYFEAYAPRSGIGYYLKIILESYAIQTREVRERIYFKQTIDKVERAIINHTVISYKENQTVKKLCPYAIYKPTDKNSLELIYGIPDKNTEGGIINTIKIKSLAIQELREYKEKFKVLGDEEFLKRFFNEKATVSAKPTETFIIKFTYGGLQRFIHEEDSLPIIGIPNPNNKYLYTFTTNETQIFLYIFKFGLQAQIITPLDARERFKKLFKASYEAYMSVDEK